MLTKDTTGDWTPGTTEDVGLPPSFTVVCMPEMLDGISNGDLIAAAPEMLELLKTTASNIRSLGPAGVFGPVPTPYQIWLQAIEDVIAKAGR